MGAWQITIKDLRLIVQDKGALSTLLLLPVVVIAILGMSTGQMITEQDSSTVVKLGLVDEDRSAVSENVFRDLSAIGGLEVEQVPGRDEAKLHLQDGRLNVVVILGKDFHNRVDNLDLADVLDTEHGKLAEGLAALDMHVESGAAFVGVADLVQYVVLSAVLRVVGPDVVKRNRLVSRLIDRMIERHKGEVQSAGGKQPQAVEPNRSAIYQTLVPAFIVMFAFFLINIMASSYIAERKLGTLRRMQMTRVSPVQLLLGKTLPFLFVSIVQCLLLFLSGRLMFGMSWGTYPAMLLPVIVTTSIASTGLGLLLATIVRTESQVSSYSTFLIVFLAGISGCYMPRAWLPELMKKISLATPHAWALIAYQELLTRDHPSLRVVIESCAVMTAFGCVCFALGSLRFRRMEYPT
jgi:ABC-2 type transport system permease protein